MSVSVTPRGGVLTAADAALTDYYGKSTSLSSDGLILAVGAPDWEGAYTDQGGVYIYDWSGSAWVQRGSVLVAGDAAGNERFGSSVSLSSDGTILAVGSINQDAAGSVYTYAGAVYIYDWSGSAWVQRGSAFTSTSAEADFGDSVCLSASGSILAVGEKSLWNGTASVGGVHIFDWSGSAWSQRGSVLRASDAASGDEFGAGVALSSTGSVLVVGARRWEGALSNQGGVYVYDWSGSAWSQRGSVLTAADAAASDFFGASVSLSGDASLLAVGADGWENATSGAGGVYLLEWSSGAWVQSGSVIEASDAAENDAFSRVALASAKAVLTVGAYGRTATYSSQGGVYTFDLAGVVTGTPTAPTALTVAYPTGTPTAPTALTVAYPTGTPTAPTALTVTATGTPTAPTALAVIPSGHVPRWRARCLIDGADVSAQLTGVASVTAEEGAARIARLTIQPPAGIVAPLDYVGRAIVIDYVLVVNGTDLPRRLFTGRIDTPHYDPNTGLLAMQCVDDLQNRVAALDRTTLDALIGGRYTAAVQGEIDDNWDYAKALLSTVAGSLDAAAHGGLRLTPWEIAGTWSTYDEGDLLDQRMVPLLPQRSTLVNSVSIAFDYRYARLRQRYTTVAWSGTQIDMAPCGWQYPTQQDILGACNGSGWTATLGVFYPAPAAIPHNSGGFIRPPAGSIDLAVVRLTQRHAQTVTEGYAITVTAPESVTANGELPHALRGALASDFDGGAWESALDVAPLMPTGGEQDYSPDADRAAADYAIQTLLDQARVKILGSHRSARVSNAILCNPDLDLDKKVSIDTAAVQAIGKVASINHVLDFKTGSAITEFSVALFGVGGAGIITPDTLEPPAPPDEAIETQNWASSVPSLFVSTFGGTPYAEGLMGLLLNPPETVTVEDVPGEGTQVLPNSYYVEGTYPVEGFRVRMPGVDDADRNPINKPVSASYQILVPEDTLTFTAP